MFGPSILSSTEHNAVLKKASFVVEDGKIRSAQLEFTTVKGEQILVSREVAKEMLGIAVTTDGYLHLWCTTLTQYSRRGSVIHRYHSVLWWRHVTDRERATDVNNW